ncbi:MAG: competence/damage-inducible protein A [Desulfobacterota bacterium]|jgi:nicotinamide-nucleotide amidase|nr:competence/damage-inducible protein A [Thermodesulfobacteriota bacterium]
MDVMYGEIITIGDELISGRVVDLNAWYAAGRLTATGLRVTRVTTVGDDQEGISRALQKALKDSQFVIITGGLGSTDDDITNEIAASALNRPLCLDEEMYDQIKDYVALRGLKMSRALEKMAWMPEDAKILCPRENVCGFSLVENKVRLYFLPGVPEQMRFLMDEVVIPDLLLQCTVLPALRHRVLKLYGLNEPSIAEKLSDLPGKSGNIILGFYPRFPENHITLSLRAEDQTSAASELDTMEREIRSRVGAFVFGTGDQTMEGVVGEALVKKKLTLAVAESCTGGLIGNLLTNVAGSSGYFLGGVIVYSNQAKMDLLGLSRQTLETYGAVSDPVARDMAAAVRKALKADLGLAVTGIAGPDGGTEEKPVGTVHIGLALGEELFSGKYRFWGKREQNKMNSAVMALDWVRRVLYGNPFLPGL